MRKVVNGIGYRTLVVGPLLRGILVRRDPVDRPLRPRGRYGPGAFKRLCNRSEICSGASAVWPATVSSEPLRWRGSRIVLVKHPKSPTQYRLLIERTKPPTPVERTTEGELDRLLCVIDERRKIERKRKRTPKVDPLVALRDLTIKELVPAFVALVEKYGGNGIAMHMDASNLLEGGREIKFEFAYGSYRMELQGTVVTDAIAFHEVRHAPDIQGDMVAGPMLRLKTLSADTFREFVCGRVMVLIRLANRRH